MKLALILIQILLICHSYSAFSCADTFNGDDDDVEISDEKLKKLMGSDQKLARHTTEFQTHPRWSEKEIHERSQLITEMTKFLIETIKANYPNNTDQETLYFTSLPPIFLVLNAPISVVQHFRKELLAIRTSKKKKITNSALLIESVLAKIVNQRKILPIIELLNSLPVTNFSNAERLVPNLNKIAMYLLEKGIQEILTLGADDKTITQFIFSSFRSFLFNLQEVSLIEEKLDPLYQSADFGNYLKNLAEKPLKDTDPLFRDSENRFMLLCFLMKYPNLHDSIEKILTNPENKLPKMLKELKIIREIYTGDITNDKLELILPYLNSSSGDIIERKEDLIVITALHGLTLTPILVKTLRDYSLIESTDRSEMNQRKLLWIISTNILKTNDPYRVLDGLRSANSDIVSRSVEFILNYIDQFQVLSKEDLQLIFNFAAQTNLPVSKFKPILDQLSEDRLSGFMLNLLMRFPKSLSGELTNYHLERLTALANNDMDLTQAPTNTAAFTPNQNELQFMLDNLGKPQDKAKKIIFVYLCSNANVELPKDFFPLILDAIVQNQEHIVIRKSLYNTNLFVRIKEGFLKLISERKFFSVDNKVFLQNLATVFKNLTNNVSQDLRNNAEQNYVDLLIFYLHQSLSSSSNPGVELAQLKRSIEGLDLAEILSSDGETKFGEFLNQHEATLKPKDSIIKKDVQIRTRIEKNESSHPSNLHKKQNDKNNTHDPRISSNETESETTRLAELITRMHRSPTLQELNSMVEFLSPEQLNYEDLRKVFENKNLKGALSTQVINDESNPNLARFIRNFDYKTIKALLLESKSSIFPVSFLSLELKATNINKKIANLENIHRALSELVKLAEHSKNQEISNLAHKTLKNIMISWHFKVPDVFQSYFTGTFLDRVCSDNSKKSFDFLISWIAAQTNSESFDQLLERVSKAYEEFYLKANLEEMISRISHANQMLNKEILKEEEDSNIFMYEAAVASLVIFRSYGFMSSNFPILFQKIRALNGNLNDSQILALGRIEKIDLTANGRPSIVSGRFAKDRDFFENNRLTMSDLDQSISHYSSTAWFLRDEKKLNKSQVGNFDVQESMEKSSIFTVIAHELSKNRWVWVVDNQHSLGYDILSFDPVKNKFYSIEVKAKLDPNDDVYLSMHEIETSEKLTQSNIAQSFVYIVDIQSNVRQQTLMADKISKYSNIGIAIKSLGGVKQEGKKLLIPRHILNTNFKFEDL